MAAVSAADVLKWRADLEKSSDADRSADILRLLLAAEITVEVMAETRIGAVVSKHKKHTEPAVAQLAKSIVKKWKDVATAAGVVAAKATSSVQLAEVTTTQTTEVIKVNVTQNGSAAAPAVSIESEHAHAQNGTPNGAETEQSVTIRKTTTTTVTTAPAQPDVAALNEDGLLPGRLNIRKKLWEIFASMKQDDDGYEQMSPDEASITLEREVYKRYPEKTGYLDKVRTLLFNLRKNTDLLREVLTTETSMETLVGMSSADMATSEAKEAKKREQQAAFEARQSDWRKKNAAEIQKQCGIAGGIKGMFACIRCKSDQTEFYQKQTRSADEPMTTFVTCLKCSKKWRFC